MIRRHSFPTTRQGLNRKGFTLIEILVVLAIAAIVSSITLGGFNEMRAGNKRVSCSTNLSQLYQAARLYAADEGGKFPYYEADCAAGTSEGIGLWSLYTFPQGSSAADSKIIAPIGEKPVERYLRSTKSFHCPADISEETSELYTSADRTDYDPAYLSYQTCDTEGGLAKPTYSSVRTTDPAAPNNAWERQLLHFKGSAPLEQVARQPSGDTIVTYCLHHRGERGLDNVLFYDGSIQLLPQGSTPDDNWQREPKAPQ